MSLALPILLAAGTKLLTGTDQEVRSGSGS
jgi:hypothetical protein